MLSGARSITGLDIDADSIAFARSRYPAIQFAIGRMGALPFAASAFDIILCLEGLEHVLRSEALSFTAEAWRLLAGGGYLIATIPLLTGGRHSGNPYHLFEYTEASASRVLNRYFEAEEWEVFAGPGGDAIWFVGKRRTVPLEEVSGDDVEVEKVAARALRWLDGIRSEDGFCYAPGQPVTLVSTCLGVLLLESTGALENATPAERSQWIRYIRSCQEPDTGLFRDPKVEIHASASHDAAYIEWHTTYLAIQALDALGEKAAAPLRFIDPFAAPNAVETWLDGLDWRNPWRESNRIMSLLATLIYAVERENRVEQAAVYHRILDWLDRRQDPNTGLWGAAEGVPLLNAVAGAYHFLPFYEYVHRPITAINQIVDSTLSLQQDDGLFSAEFTGGACEDLDAVDVLTLALRHTSHRQDEVKQVLVRAYWAVWNLQNEDGSFPYGRSTNPDKTYSFGGCSALTAGVNSGDVWSTWFRLLLLATVSAQLPQDLPACKWSFRRWPALGYHYYGPHLSKSESTALPLWIRRAALPHDTGRPALVALVTVVITCYNLGEYLHEAISSVFEQTLQPVRVILVDDGSTDPFTNFLLDLMPWEGVQLVRQGNRGVAAARNAGIELASTPYICCLDGDDRLLPEYLAKAVAILEDDSGAGFVSCHYRLFDCDQGAYRYDKPRFPEMLVRNEVAGVAVFRKDAWRKVGGYNEALSGMHDWDFWIGILEAGYHGTVIPEILFDYRVRPRSMYSVSSRPENYERLVRIIVSRHPAAYQQFFGDTAPAHARQFQDLVNFHRRRLADRDRTIARLRRELAREHRVSAERSKWIQDLEEAKQWFVGQLKLTTEEKEQAEQKIVAAESRAAELEAEVERLRAASRTAGAPEPVRWMRRVRGTAVAAAMLLSPAGLGARLRNLLFLVKAYAGSESRRLLTQLYDDNYYLTMHPDVAASGVPGFIHYFCAGYLEGRNPSEKFDLNYYLRRYPDVSEAGIHPLLHYVLFGAWEGRSAGARPSLRGSPHKRLSSVPPERVTLDNRWPAGLPLVSVIIPCFNYGQYVEEAIRSVLNQTFSNYEIIVIEGGSTDGVTPERLREMQRKYPDVRFEFRTGRHLAGDNRNYGIRLARGRYICCLDADDLLRPTYLEVAVFLAEAHGYDLVYPSVQAFGNSEEAWIVADASFPEIAAGNQVSTVAVFRKAAWEAVGGFRDWGTGQEYVYEDWDFWLRLVGQGFRAKAIPERLMSYRVHENGLTSGCRTSNEDQRRAIAQANRDLLEKAPKPPREVEVVRPWVNLGPLPPGGGGSLLLALPFITFGGAEKHFFMLVKGLVERGYRITVITTEVLPDSVPKNNELFDPLTPSVYHLPELFPDDRVWPGFIRYLLRRYNLRTIVVAGCEFLYHMLPEITAEFPDVRILDQLFNDTGHIKNNRRYAAMIDVNIVPSKALANTLIQKFGEKPAKVCVIPNGTDFAVPSYKDRAEAFAASGLPAGSAGKFIVSFFGRFSEEKSPLTFIEIARRLASHADIDFCMAGDGPERPEALKLISRYGLEDRFFVPGLVRDVRPLLAASDVVVVPSKLDGMPQIVVEAQLSGKPVVGSAVGGIPEMIVDGSIGFLCLPGDVNGFLSRIEQLHENADLRRSMGTRARAFATEKYSLRKMVDSYIAAFERS